MAGMLERDDWRSVLDRWREAGLVDEETSAAIRLWEAERSTRRLSGRMESALSYLGVSILLAGVLMLTFLALDDEGVLLFVGGALALVLARVSVPLGMQAMSDGMAGAGVILLAIGVAWLLDESFEEGSAAAGWAIVCVSVLLTGGLMMRVVRSPMAAFLSALALVTLPLAVAVEGGALDTGIYRDLDLRTFALWSQWTTLGLIVVIGVALLLLLERARQWGGAPLAIWTRLGASLGMAIGILGLAGASGDPLMDWLSLLGGWLVTAWALRRQRVELLPASALLLLGAMGGGLCDLDDERRIALALVVMFTTMELAVVGLASRRWMGSLAEHWLTPIWEGALLLGGVIAAAILAVDSVELAVVGLVWSLMVAAYGVWREHRGALVFGLLGVYLSWLLLVIEEFETSTGAIIGTLVFGGLVVLGAIVWRRRRRDAPGSVRVD